MKLDEHLLKVAVTSAFSLDNGLFLDVADREEDFWLCLGDLVGWGRFSKRTHRKPGCVIPTLFELVEVLPAHSATPYPVVLIANVLWRQKEAIEAERYTPLFQGLLSALEKGSAQYGQGSDHES